MKLLNDSRKGDIVLDTVYREERIRNAYLI